MDQKLGILQTAFQDGRPAGPSKSLPLTGASRRGRAFAIDGNAAATAGLADVRAATLTRRWILEVVVDLALLGFVERKGMRCLFSAHRLHVERMMHPVQARNRVLATPVCLSDDVPEISPAPLGARRRPRGVSIGVWRAPSSSHRRVVDP